MPDRTRRTGDLVSENNIFVDIANDRIGIGTTVPEYDLDIGGLENSIDPQNAGFGTVRIASHLGIGHSDLTATSAKPENTSYGGVLTLGSTADTAKTAYIIFDTNTGSSNDWGSIAIGDYTNLKSGGATNNIAIGGKNLYNVRSSSNIAIGSQNLQDLTTTSSANIGIGYQTLGGATTSSSYNIALGYRAGASGASNTVEDNIFIGRSAGRNALSSNSKNNIYIGKESGQDGTSTGRDRNIVIGNVPAAKVGDDQFAIGVDDGVGDYYWLVGDENKNIGIGTTNPTASVGVGNTAVLAVGIVSAYQLYVNGSPVSGGGISSVFDDSTPRLGGTLDTNGNLIQFGDSSSAANDRLQFGASQDLQIYHDGSHSYIQDTGEGNLILSGSDIEFYNVNLDEYYARFITDGAAELYYDNSKKFETTGIGVSVLSGTGLTATIAGPSNLIIDPGTVGDNTGIVRIKGDLFVDGTQTQINSTTIELADFVVGIATTATSDLLADGAGIGIGSDKTFKYYHNGGTIPSLKSSENLNVASGKAYQIDQSEVLNATTLGIGVTNSSLTSVGNLTSLTVSGDISIADKIVHIDDIDTAIRFPAADTFTVETAGSERVRVDSNGNVGIGSTIPTEKLDIVGNIAVTGTVDGRNLVTDGSKLDAIEANADVTDSINVDSAGAVMETDTSTANMLFVVDEDNMASDSPTKVPTQQSVKAYVDANSGGGSSYWVQTDVGIHTLSSVGIGTTNSQSKLEINVGTAVSAFDIQGSAGQLFSVTNNLTSGSIFSVNDVTGIPSIDVDADGTIQLAPFGSTEYVGIGTTNPTQKLDVNGNVAIGGSIYDANGTSGSDGQVLSNVTGFGVSWTDQSSGGSSAINDLSDAVTYSSGRSVGLGTGALIDDNGTDNDNTALGYKALNANTSGSGMTGIGHSALAKAGNGSGNACTAVGYFALNANTSGSDNTAVGYQALQSNISAQRSTAMGYQAVEGASTANYATGFGAFTLRDLTTGDNNTAIGAFAGDDITTGSNNTCVGYGATASSTSVSNEITLGNTSVTSLRIPGLQSAASDGDVLTYNSTNGNITLAAASGGSSYWVQTDVGIHTLSSVGIGTTNPEATLQIDVGTGTTAFDVLGSEGTLFSVTNNLTSGSIFSVNDVSGVPSINVDADGTIQLAPFGTTEYVGIGITNPTSKLTVAGDSASAQLELRRTNTGGGGSIGAINFTALDGHSVASIHALGDGDDEGAHIIFRTTSDATSNTPYTISERVRIGSAGQIGLGGANYGGSGQVLTSNGSSSAPTWQGVPTQNYVKYGAQGTPTTTNLNASSSYTVVQWINTTPQFSNGTWSATNSAITVPNTGIYQVSANFFLTSGAARSNVGMRFAVNGTVQSNSTAAHAYIRVADGHGESSVNMTTLLNLNANDTISVFTRRYAATGTVTLNSGGSSISIHQIA